MLTQVEMLQLSPWEFDQGPHGWRALDEVKDMEGAVEVMRAYLVTHADGTQWRRSATSDPDGRVLPVALLQWHLGQVMAVGSFSEGILDEITDHMEKARKGHPDPRFRAYIRGTIAFLLADEKELKRARKQDPVHPEVLERASRRMDGSHHPYYLILMDPAGTPPVPVDGGT